MTVDPRRAAVLVEARAWLGTPFHHEARLKGIGVDCGQLLIAVYGAAGLVPPGLTVPHYPPDFAMHRDREWYLEWVERFGRPIEGPPLPGDVVLFRWGRLFSHGAIVTAWPRLIHAWAPARKVVAFDANFHPLAARERRFFSPFGEG